MANRRAFRRYSDFTIPANSSATIHVQGRYISCYAATAGFEIGLDDGSLFDFFAGAEMDLADADADFEQLDLINDTGSPIVVSLAVGFGQFRDRRFSFSGTLPTLETKAATLADTADVSLGAAATTLILAANAARREIIIANLSLNTETMRIGASTAGAARGVPLAPGQSITLATTAAVYGYNPGAGAESVAVAEVED